MFSASAVAASAVAASAAATESDRKKHSHVHCIIHSGKSKSLRPMEMTSRSMQLQRMLLLVGNMDTFGLPSAVPTPRMQGGSADSPHCLLPRLASNSQYGQKPGRDAITRPTGAAIPAHQRTCSGRSETQRAESPQQRALRHRQKQSLCAFGTHMSLVIYVNSVHCLSPRLVHRLRHG